MANKNILVGVLMGSDSDWQVMERCVKQLKDFGIGCEVRVLSAHRTPDEVHEYASSARQRGLKVLVAGAGMSAALAGVLASKTTLPVIGVPMASGMPSGLDAALSTMQMPPGIPVACVAIGPVGATNAAILAAQIIALGDGALAGKLEDYKAAQAKKVLEKDSELQKKISG